MSPLPSLFVSHGAPNLVIDNIPATGFLSAYGSTLRTPRAIVVASAHFEANPAQVSADQAPEMIYDFKGFEPELYELTYPAPGDPELAGRIVDLLGKKGIDAVLAHDRGYDHGTWVPLMLMFPGGKIPVVQLSVSPDLGAEHHYRMGQTLQPLHDDDVLVVGSGSLTHNLSAFFRGGFKKDAAAPDWVEDFAAWMHEKVSDGDIDALLDYRSQAPFAVENHPSEEHLLPFFVAAGAAASHGKHGERVHASTSFGVLAMDAYAFH